MMADCKLPLLTDKEVQESITNIDTWLATHAHSGLHAIRAEDLAIAVPGECFFMELLQENEEAHRELEKGILVYTDAREEQYLWLKGDWHPLERVLSITSNKEGWHQTQSLGERLLVLVLTQLDYRARESEGEVPYGCCSPTHPTYLLWRHHRLAGMASLRCQGTSIWGGEEVYACDTLDTVYVRPAHRRQGYTLALLSTLAARLAPGEHLGLSHPISLSMCKVLLKFIQVCPELRDRLWTLDEDGEVSGTVMLMLGSLMMRGVLCPPQPPAPLQPPPAPLYSLNVLLKFIQVCPELRDRLWTLDEDGEVSGTVMLMLGSLMMRGVLCPPQPPAPLQPPPAPPTTLSSPNHCTKPTPMCTNTSIPMCTNAPLGTNNSLTNSAQDGSAVTQMVTSDYERLPSVRDGGEVASLDKDEPCDTS
ncbi:uncharacterized protein LOC108679326 [Hyalella azteca]|uniref:Uncharacterized protein LOC108679326 n=1 Tax=Hyalella azteca TaxID=294128 RepID=A0A979FHM2_HYAAZ|nr:uncharacterized protein LOC108679326 [Hyalella azteca]